jgi:hypothetical protein
MDNRIHSRALLRGDQKFVIRVDGGTEMFDLATTRRRSRRPSPRPRRRRRCRRRSLSRKRVSASARRPSTPVAPVDEKLKERLRALGYQP